MQEIESFHKSFDKRVDFSPAALPPDWLTPQWACDPQPQGVRAIFTSRTGGFSNAPFGTMNLGDHVGDEPQAVAANRAHLAALLGIDLRFIKQVHGWAVAECDDVSCPVTNHDGADALLSSRSGVGCVIMVADCLPLLWAHRAGWCVGAVHAGWRGLAGGQDGGVIEHFWQHWCAKVRTLHMKQAGEAAPALSDAQIAADTCVWLGPCIGAAAFEVGEDVRAAFLQTAGTNEYLAMNACFRATGHAGKYWADLAQLARLRLAALGIEAISGNDSSTVWCTVQNSEQYFSHRRDAAKFGSTGRMAGVIWRE